MRNLVTVLSVLALATACGGDPATSDGVVRTDSAGVRLITSGARDTVLPWTFREIDVFRLGDRFGSLEAGRSPT